MKIQFLINILTFKLHPIFSILLYLVLIVTLITFIRHLRIKKKAYEIIFEYTKWPKVIAKYPFYREFVISDILFLTPVWGGINIIPIIMAIIFIIIPNRVMLIIFLISVIIWLIYSLFKDYSVDSIFRINRYETKQIYFIDYFIHPFSLLNNWCHKNLKKVIDRPDMLDYIYSDEKMEFLKKKL